MKTHLLKTITNGKANYQIVEQSHDLPKDTKLKIEINQMSVDNYNQFMREAMCNKDESRAIASLELLIKHENKVTELETYLAELEEL
jgi:hypothetical protein